MSLSVSSGAFFDTFHLQPFRALDSVEFENCHTASLQNVVCEKLY